MSTHPLRKLIHKTGIDVRKYRPEPDRMGWLKVLGIKTVIDVGANVGQFASEARIELPDAFIYSFEPLPDCYDKLLQSRAHDKKFKAFNFALGEETGKSEINRSTYSPSSSILKMSRNHEELFPSTKGSTKQTIEVKRMDDALKNENMQKEILLKIDTQGYEAKVIAGGPETLKSVKAIIVETSYIELYADQPLFRDIYNTLTQAGFSYRGAMQQKLNPSDGSVVSEDSVFCR